MATTDPFGEDSYAQVKMEPTEDDEFLYGKKDEAQAPEVKGEDPFETSMQPPSDSIPPETEEPPEEDYEDDDEEEGVQIVLNTEAINSPDAAAGAGTSAFPKRPLFSRPQPNQQRPGSTPVPNYQAQRGQPGSQMQSPIVGQPPGSKSAFDIDIDGLEEKPWRKPGADITDFFNYGFNEETWKGYCQKQVTLRLEQSMQGKIKVYSSDQSASDMPAELLALTGGDSKSRSKQDRPSSSSIKREGGSSKSTSGPPGDWSRQPDHSRRRQREQDDSVIQVLASGDDRSEDRERDRERSPRSGSPGSPRGPPFIGLPMGRFPIPIPGMPPRGPPPYDRDFRRRSRSPPRYRDDRGPPDRYRDEFRDPRDRRREERPRDPRDERPREDRPREERSKEREERRDRDKDRDESNKRPPKREESEDRAKRSRH